MPGYLVKAANFVAEIANDDELVKLAEVDTIKKDTKIRILPDKEWVLAKNIPLLRKVWGLDPTGKVPPQIKPVAAGIVSPASSKLPPRLETVIDSRAEIIARAAAQAAKEKVEEISEGVTNVHKDAKLDEQLYAFEMQVTQPVQIDITETKTALRTSLDDIAANIHFASSITSAIADEIERENAADEQKRANAQQIAQIHDDLNSPTTPHSGVRLDETVATIAPKATNDETVATTSQAANAQTAQPLANAQTPANAQIPANAQTPVNAQTPANAQILANAQIQAKAKTPANAQESAQAMPDDIGARTESLLLRMRNMADDEYIEAEPNEVTYVMESSLVRESMAERARASSDTKHTESATTLQVDAKTGTPIGDSRADSRAIHNTVRAHSGSIPRIPKIPVVPVLCDCPSIDISLDDLGSDPIQSPIADRAETPAHQTTNDVVELTSERTLERVNTRHKTAQRAVPPIDADDADDETNATMPRPQTDLSEAILESGIVSTSHDDMPRSLCLEAARAAVDAARQYVANSDNPIDNSILERASELVEALERARLADAQGDASTKHERNRINRKNVSRTAIRGERSLHSDLHSILDSSSFTEENEDDSPSEQFKIRRSSDVLPHILDKADDIAHVAGIAKLADLDDLASAASATTPAHKPKLDPKVVDDDFEKLEEHSDVLKIQNTSTLRHMLRAEARAAASDSELLPAPSQDLSTKDGVRTLFEKEDELHLYLANEIREKELQAERELSHDDDILSKKSKLRKEFNTLQAMTDEMPVVNERAVVRKCPARDEKTNVAANPVVLDNTKKEPSMTFDDPFFKERLMDDEQPIAIFSSFYLTTHRIWNVTSNKKHNVKNCEVYDIENIQGTSLHEERKYIWPIIDIALIIITGLYYFFIARHSGNTGVSLIVLIYACLMLPVCYYMSFYTVLQINIGSTILKSKCHINRDNKSDAMMFLNRIEAVRIERRKARSN